MIRVDIGLYGHKNWVCNRLLHRVNGPAVVYPKNQYRAWYRYGQLNRTDGPARVWNDGCIGEYWINGYRLSDYELMFTNGIIHD